MESGSVKSPSAVTWYTQPAKSFSSYYYYDKTTKALVRVRMELGRQVVGDYSGTAAFYQGDRHVGFADPKFDDVLLRAPAANFSLTTDGRIQVKNGSTPLTLDADPTATHVVCDFSGSSPDKLKDDEIHIGNPVAAKSTLPPGVSEDMLKKIALKAITAKDNIPLSTATATDDELAAAIKKAAQ